MRQADFMILVLQSAVTRFKLPKMLIAFVFYDGK